MESEESKKIINSQYDLIDEYNRTQKELKNEAEYFINFINKLQPEDIKISLDNNNGMKIKFKKKDNIEYKEDIKIIEDQTNQQFKENIPLFQAKVEKNNKIIINKQAEQILQTQYNNLDEENRNKLFNFEKEMNQQEM